jgi:transposase-like protein
MAKLSVRAAAAKFEVSRPTLTKWLKDGKISGERLPQDEGGGWLIDSAELARVGVKPRSASEPEAVNAESANGGKLTAFDRGLPGNNDAEVSALKAALELEKARREAAENLAEERAAHIEDLRRMLPAPEAGPQRKRWWPF